MSNMIVFLYFFITDYLKVPTYILCQQHKTSFGQSPIRVFVEPSKKNLYRVIYQTARQLNSFYRRLCLYSTASQIHCFSQTQATKKMEKICRFFYEDNVYDIV